MRPAHVHPGPPFAPTFAAVRNLLFSCLLICFACAGRAQVSAPAGPGFFAPADTFRHDRFYTSLGIATTIYGTISIGLWEAWYQEFELTGFHSFDDWGEWEDMDKAGHLMTTYNEANSLFKGALWTGMDRRKAKWAAAGGAMLLQSTVEVMDGFSAEWGFSWADMGFNVAGAGLFVAQEEIWGEQRILFKLSSVRPDYPTTPIYSVDGQHQTTLLARADALYGASFGQLLIKDYNAQIIWASINPRSFSRNSNSKLPPWLNLAVGYGAGNMYGGFTNEWTDDRTGAVYRLDPAQYPRTREFYLSLDIDFTRLGVKNHFWRTVLSSLNFVKFPAPVIGVDTRGQFFASPLYW